MLHCSGSVKGHRESWWNGKESRDCLTVRALVVFGFALILLVVNEMSL